MYTKEPLEYVSLEPFIGDKTLDIHYNKHYLGYLNKLNTLLEKAKYHGNLTKEEMVKNIDIFNIKDKNIVVFPNGNWVTNKVYYNSQKGEYLSLVNEAVSEEEIKNNNDYATKLLDVSNDIIVFDLLKPKEELERKQQNGKI